MGFLDSFQEATNKIQKETKYKKTISDNKANVEKMYSEMGRKVYETRTIDEGLVAYIGEKVEAIDKLLKENEELQVEILKLNNKKICPNCKAEVDINTMFCPQCGKEQEKVEVEPFVPTGKRKCSGCGQVIDDKNVFCPNCGAKKEVVEEPKTADVKTDEAKEVEVVENAEIKAEEAAEEKTEE